MALPGSLGPMSNLELKIATARLNEFSDRYPRLDAIEEPAKRDHA